MGMKNDLSERKPLLNKKNMIKAFFIFIALFLVAMLILDIQANFTGTPNSSISHARVLANNPNLSATSISNRPFFVAVGGWAQFFYFTILSNIAIVAVISMSWIFGYKFSRIISNMFLAYISITFLIFWAALSWMYGLGQNPWYDYFATQEHLIIPLFGLVWAIKNQKTEKKVKHQTLIYLSVPALYLLMALIVFFSFDAVLYPFTDITDWFALGWPVWASILGYIFMVILSMGFFYLVFWFYNKFLKRFTLWTEKRLLKNKN